VLGKPYPLNVVDMPARRRTGRGKGTRRRKRKPPTPEPLIEKGFREIVDALGLDILGLSEEELREALVEPVAMVLGASKPTIEALVKRLQRNMDKVYQLISAYILEHRDHLSEEQLEFVASYGGRILLPYMDRLYREALRLGREDLIASLRAAWEKYGRPSPIRCPRCGFRAVDPGLTCMICGYTLSEKEARRQLGFEDLLVMVASTSPRSLVEELLDSEAVYVSSRGIYPIHRAPREEAGVVLELTPRDKKLIREAIRGEKSA
jgi:ribosomal protein L37E